MRVCTVLTRSRLAHARVLTRSLLEHNPAATVTALVLDDRARSIAGEEFEIVRPTDLDLDPRELDRMVTMYEPLQLSCAMKAWMLRHLVDEGADAAVYLDTDIEVFDSLAEIAERARAHSIVLTPHLTKPPPRPPVTQEEEARFLGGTFNLGFIAVSPSARPFLDWWCERLARDCIHEPERGYFDDQRWIDFVPGYFQHHVHRDPGCNVASWNLPTRAFEWDDGRYRVDGAPLRFFHFGGFDPGTPYLISKWLRPKPHTRLSQNRALARLCHDYARKLHEQGYAHCIGIPYGFAQLPNGRELDASARTSYREALISAEQRERPEPPNPYSDGAETFLAWLRDPDGWHGGAHRPPPDLVAMHARRRTIGMTSEWERAYLHRYAGHRYTGEGEIVELGCWLGALTVPLAMGLAENVRPAAAARRVQTYDRFRWDDVMADTVAGTALEGRLRHGDTFRPEFEILTAPWRHRIEVHEGDIRELGWKGEEIELLLVDAMKSWDLANCIVRDFFPSLRPGSHVVHQDFTHWCTFWIHLVMYRLREWFEAVYDVPRSGSVVFRLRAPLPPEQLSGTLSLDSFGEQEIEDAFHHSLSIVAPDKRPHVAGAKIMALAELGDLERARSELESWSRGSMRWRSDLLLVAEALAGRRAPP